MTIMQFTDKAPLSGTRKTVDGFLVAEAFAVRTGIQSYAGSEIGLVDRDVVRVWRPEEEVRSPTSLATFSHAPVTLGHPSVSVTADNWKDLAKGEVSTEAEWKDDKIKLPLIIKDKAAIDAIEGGTQELSAGYKCQLELVDGVTDAGEAYDAVQRNISINHLAIVPKGRAGSECRIGDAAVTWGAKPCPPTSKTKEDVMSDALMTVVLGDVAVSVTALDAASITKFKADCAKHFEDAQTAHTAAIAAKDAEIGTLKADNKKLSDAAMTPEKLSAMVADRAALESTVTAVDKNIKVEGVSDADLRKAAVVAKLGEDMVKDASDAEVSGMFKAVAKDAKTTDTFADTLKQGITPTSGDVTDVADKAYRDNVTDMSDAWKYGPSGKKEAS